MLRRAAALGLVLTVVVPPAALAQTTNTTIDPYPGAPTPPDQPTSAEIDFGLQEVGAVLNVNECNFKPGTPVRIVVHGVTISPDAIADARGCVLERIEVLPNLVALGRAPGRMFAATGLAATAVNVQIKVNGQVITVGPYGTRVTSVSTGTGSNNFPRTVTFHFTVVKRGTISRQGIVRTGAQNVMRWTPLGVGLIALGYLLVLSTRRRPAR
jgi:hypothetical protein